MANQISAVCNIWKFKDNGTAYIFTLHEAKLRFIFTRIYQHKSSAELSAQLLVENIETGRQVHFQTINLLSVQAREKIANSFNFKFPSITWGPLIDDICYTVIQKHTEGQPVETVWGDIENFEVLQPKYILSPLIYEGESNILFGQGKSGKSYLALLFCLLCKLPYPDNPLRLIPKAANPLYLDYERSKELFRQRLSLMCRGLEVAPVPIDYRRCFIPLADDVDNILKTINEKKNDLIVIDSVGIACAGDLNSSETATRFAAALHRLPVTSILITHTSKTEEGKKTPIGSVYFTNSASNIFEVKKSQDMGNSYIDIALSHYECNLGPKIEPLGFRLEFQNNSTRIIRQELSDIPELAGNVPIRQQCKQALESGPMTVKEITETTGLNQESIKTKLNKYKDDFVRDGEKWRLKLA